MHPVIGVRIQIVGKYQSCMVSELRACVCQQVKQAKAPPPQNHDLTSNQFREEPVMVRNDSSIYILEYIYNIYPTNTGAFPYNP